MNDNRARDALAAALDDTYSQFYTADEMALAILDYRFTPDQRRALAAAFLDVETLAWACAHPRFPGGGDGKVIAGYILAALRETPVRMIPESDATHGYTCGSCSWGRDGDQDRTYWDYLDHRVETGHDPVVSGPTLIRETP